MIAQTKTGESQIRILGISGSGRKGSYNTALLEAAKELAPESVFLETFDISNLPLYNHDLEARLPLKVVEFKKRVREADAILFAAPEHNYTITAVMKNAIEWGNRPSTDNSWDNKPRSYHERLVGSAGRSESTTAPPPDTGGPQHVSDQQTAHPSRERGRKV